MARSKSTSPTSCSIGPPACGKTLLARTLAQILNVPFAIGDATTLTEAGYVGEDVENLLPEAAAPAADFDLERCSRGIIHRRDRQDRQDDQPQRVASPATSGGEVRQAYSRCSKGPWPTCRRKASASTPSSSTFNSTQPTSCSSAAAVRRPGQTLIARGVGTQDDRLRQHATQAPSQRSSSGDLLGQVTTRRHPGVRHDPRVHRPPAGSSPRSSRST